MSTTVDSIPEERRFAFSINITGVIDISQVERWVCLPVNDERSARLLAQEAVRQIAAAAGVQVYEPEVFDGDGRTVLPIDTVGEVDTNTRVWEV